MASIDQIASTGSSSFLSRFADRFFDWCDRLIESNARVKEVNYYSSLSDAELAKLGLTRDTIVRHVFRDKLV